MKPHRHGDKTIEKTNIFCPFCCEDTKRWKLIPTVWLWNVRRTEVEPNAIDEKMAKKFETDVLTKHMEQCKFAGIVTQYALDKYNLLKGL